MGALKDIAPQEELTMVYATPEEDAQEGDVDEKDTASAAELTLVDEQSEGGTPAAKRKKMKAMMAAKPSMMKAMKKTKLVEEQAEEEATEEGDAEEGTTQEGDVDEEDTASAEELTLVDEQSEGGTPAAKRKKMKAMMAAKPSMMKAMKKTKLVEEQ